MSIWAYLAGAGAIALLVVGLLVWMRRDNRAIGRAGAVNDQQAGTIDAAARANAAGDAATRKDHSDDPMDRSNRR